jgi:hypothetical protein
MTARRFSVAMRRVVAQQFLRQWSLPSRMENRLTISALMTPTNKITFAGAL